MTKAFRLRHHAGGEAARKGAARVQRAVSQPRQTPGEQRMSKDKLTQNGFQRLPPWEDALRRYLEELKENANG